MARFKKTSDIRVGVIGYGGAFNMGLIHMTQMKQAGMTPQAVAELDKDRLKVAQQEFPEIETYTSVAQMLKKSDVNLLVIITPHDTHAKLATQCLRAGRHVVCEKPLAITTAECDRMIAEAKKRRLMLSTYHNRHWDGCILHAVKEVVQKGAIGEVVRIEAHMGQWGQPGDWWRSNKKISGGVLYDWGVHLLEYSLQLIDAKVTEVTAFAQTGVWKTKWGKDTNEDEARAIVRFDTGQYLELTQTTLDANPKPGQLEITGTKGTYIFDHPTYTHIQPKKNGSITTTTGKNPPNEGQRFYDNIADYLVGKAGLVITPEWSRRPIHILDLADKSARQGKALTAKYA
jgi:scyllo-inositol 2-dehydrogenase (NADP+)